MTAMADLLTAQAERFRLYGARELMTRVPAPWIIKGVMRQKSVTLIYGERGCYKSFLALDLAACITSNISWQGHDLLHPGLVIYIAAEGSGGMVQRIRAWDEQHPRALPNDDKLFFITEPVIVTATSEDMEWVIHRIREVIDWETPYDQATESFQPPIAIWPILIIIDTLARCFQGNESAQEDMGQFVQGVDRIRNEFNCSVLIIHHSGWDPKHERGSSALGAACDTIYKLEADPKANILTLSNEKMKDSREPKPLQLTYREVQVQRRRWDDPNEELTSVVIEHTPVRQSVNIQDLLMKAGRPLQTIEFQELAQSHGVSRATFFRHVRDLLKTGVFIRENGFYRPV